MLLAECPLPTFSTFEQYAKDDMKTAIYIEDGIVQLVLTPDSEFERNAVSTFANKPFDAVFREGSFYTCAGGWIRHNEQDRSLILIALTAPKEPTT